MIRLPWWGLLVLVAALGAGVWATWALFVAPRTAEATPEGFVKGIAARICANTFDPVADALAPEFRFNVMGTDLDAATALSLAKNERGAGRFFPLVADVTIGERETRDDGSERLDVIIVGVLARKDPSRFPDGALENFRIEAKLAHRGTTFHVLSARRVG